MYKIREVELDDVDFILDCKLNIIFNSSEITTMEKSDMEKVVNYCEEDIRENLQNYKKVYCDDEIVCVYGVYDYSDGVIIDTLYVMPHVRKGGIATDIIKHIINTNFLPLYVCIDRNNDIANKLFMKFNFTCIEKNEFKRILKNVNVKEENYFIKIKQFEDEVKKIAKKYEIKYKLECKKDKI